MFTMFTNDIPPELLPARGFSETSCFPERQERFREKERKQKHEKCLQNLDMRPLPGFLCPKEWLRRRSWLLSGCDVHICVVSPSPPTPHNSQPASYQVTTSTCTLLAHGAEQRRCHRGHHAYCNLFTTTALKRTHAD